MVSGLNSRCTNELGAGKPYGRAWEGHPPLSELSAARMLAALDRTDRSGAVNGSDPRAASTSQDLREFCPE